ncbi:hypothetical protein BHE74_00010122 [Ensete ventricosum]|nr:hypothetical protein BHE74_00010122 [Ensete ventricosum]
MIARGQAACPVVTRKGKCSSVGAVGSSTGSTVGEEEEGRAMGFSAGGEELRRSFAEGGSEVEDAEGSVEVR